MCQSLLDTEQEQEWIPDFLKYGFGEGDIRNQKPGTPSARPGGPAPINRAAEVPLGEGMVDGAREAIMSRRERIRRAVEGE